jgi:hypothetical protein
MPNTLDITNRFALLQKAATYVALPSDLFSINVKQQTKIHKAILQIGDKRSTRIFKRFITLYSETLRMFSAWHSKRTKIENTISSLLADVWLQAGVTEAYSKWVDSFSENQLLELLRVIESEAERNDCTSWHTATGGYVK